MPTPDDELHVINNLGSPFPDQVSALPGIRVTEISPNDDVPADLHADIVYTHTWGAANLPEILACGPRWVHVMGVGVDLFPLDAIHDDQVLTCARGATAGPIAEFALASMMSFAKAMPDIWIDQPPERGWFSDTRISGLHGKTVVVVGVGGIGSQVARLSLAFGMRVIGVRRRDRPSPVDGMEIATDLAGVIAEADHLVIAAPATADTACLLDASMLELVTPGLHLVNIARGSLIDQNALRVALDDERVACASLDTVSPEPLPEGHWLFSHPSVRLTPHVSWAGPGSTTSMTDAFITNYHRFRSGEPLEGVVDRALGY